VEPWLPAALDSACSQTLEDIEIICVDDGSTDGSLAILKSYAAKDSRITVLENGRNRGALYARIRSILASKGKYVLCLDADDELFPTIGERALALAKGTGADIIFFGAEEVKENGKRSPLRLMVDTAATNRARNAMEIYSLLRRDKMAKILQGRSKVMKIPCSQLWRGNLLRTAANGQLTFASQNHIVFGGSVFLFYFTSKRASTYAILSDVGYRCYRARNSVVIAENRNAARAKWQSDITLVRNAIVADRIKLALCLRGGRHFVHRFRSKIYRPYPRRGKLDRSGQPTICGGLVLLFLENSYTFLVGEMVTPFNPIQLMYHGPMIRETILKNPSLGRMEDVCEQCRTLAVAVSWKGQITRLLSCVAIFPAIYWIGCYIYSRTSSDYITRVTRFVSAITNSPQQGTARRQTQQSAPAGGQSSVSEIIRCGNFEFRPVECGGGGDCYFHTVASQAPMEPGETMMSCRRLHFRCACEQLVIHLKRVRKNYAADSPIGVRIDRLVALTQPPSSDNLNKAWVQRMRNQVELLAREIDMLEVVKEYVRNGDAQVRQAAQTLQHAIENRNLEEDITQEQMGATMRLLDNLILKDNLARVSAWNIPPGSPLLAAREELLEHINAAIADPRNQDLLDLAHQTGVVLNMAALEQHTQDSEDVVGLENLRSLKTNVTNNNYSQNDYQERLISLSRGYQLPWRVIHGRFHRSTFDDSLFARDAPGTPLFMVSRSLDANRTYGRHNWRDNDASALVRYVNYAANVTFTPTAYGGIHELELSCITYGRPVLHIENGNPETWTLAIQDREKKCHILTGQLGWQSQPRNRDGSNPIFNSDSIRDLRSLWDYLDLHDSASNAIHFPDLGPIIRKDDTSLTFTEAATSCEDVDQAIRTVTDRLRYVHEQILLHCIRERNAILCYNISQSHWQRADFVRYGE
jgi:glycosyltransferase involved in cell wall biosynthesis